jgi:hypothetical protein
MSNTMTRMTLTLAALAALVGTSLAQAPDKLTLKTGVVPMATLLKELSTASGLNLESIPRFRGEAMLLDVKDAPVNDVLTRVARAVGADWEKIEGGYRLVLTTETERKQREEEIADRAARIQKGLDQRIAGMGPTLDSNAARQAVEDALKTQEEFQRRLQQQREQAGGAVFVNANVARPSARTMPAERTALMLAKAIGERTLAGMMPGDRIVFSTSPTAVQVRMPASASQVLQEFVQQHNLVADMVRDLGKPTAEGGFHLNVQMSGQADLNAKPISRLGRVLLVVERLRENWNLQLRAYDVDGRMAGQAFTMVSAPMDAGAARLTLKHPQKPIELPPLAHEFAALLNQPRRGTSFTTGSGEVVRAIRVSTVEGMAFTGQPTPAKPVSDGWRARLSRPEAFDPLSFIVGEAVARIGTAESVNTIACLSDQAYRTQTALLRDNITVAQATGALAGTPGVHLALEEGWLTVRPKYFIEHRATQLDRVSLGQALRKGLADGRLSLDLTASYAAAQPSIVAMEGYDGDVFAALAKHIVEGETMRDHSFQREMLRLYANLNPGQRNALAQGNAVQISALNGSGRTALQRMVFNAMNFMPIQVHTEGRSRGPVDPMAANERTDALPNGIPGNGYLTMQINETPGAYATNSKTGAARVMSGYELGGMLPDPNGGNRPPSEEFDGFTPMTLRVMQFTFHFSPTTTGDQSLTDKVFPAAGTRPVPFAQLPTAFLARLQEYRNRAGSFQTTGFDVITIGGTRGGGPPPP